MTVGTDVVDVGFTRDMVDHHDQAVRMAWHQQRGDLERTSMQWMDMGTPVAAMPGMATAAELENLKGAGGADADRLFLTMMREHHRGGVHMSLYAAAHASDGDVRELATRMAKCQQVEVNEYSMLMRRLGLDA